MWIIHMISDPKVRLFFGQQKVSKCPPRWLDFKTPQLLFYWAPIEIEKVCYPSSDVFSDDKKICSLSVSGKFWSIREIFHKIWVKSNFSVGNRQIQFFFWKWEVWTLYVLFDVLNGYKAHKLTKMLLPKDGSMKRQKYFFRKNQ